MSKLKQEFKNIFGQSADEPRVCFAPGRVNLIGGHTDYNGGYVLPCSIQYGTLLAIGFRNDNKVKAHSLNFPFIVEIDIDKPLHKIGNEWVNFPLGVMKEFQGKGVRLKGMNLLFYGDIPNGAGLSSSASVEMVTAYALNKLLGCNFDTIDMIKISQLAENDFVGMNCGIMDQFAVGAGKKDKAVFLNCDTLDYDLVPLALKAYSLVITNTNKRRELADSKYNERRTECETAVENLSATEPIRNLSELTMEKFESIKNKITDIVGRKRANHVIYENQRTMDAVKALKGNDLNKFGKLMFQSHYSLKDDFEVSCDELDVLVDEASKVKGVLGSRMTGGGFGGCTVSLVKKESIQEFEETVGKNYFERTGLKADFYIARAGEGVREILDQ
ncbi:MAG: galactokinase [Chlorobi bacterium]|nr:galactokinase [Chlorobiota bacterium]